MALEGLSASSGRCFFQRSPQERWVKLALSACDWSCAPRPSSRGASALVQAFPSRELWLQHPALRIPSPGTRRSAPARAGGVPAHLLGRT